MTRDDNDVEGGFAWVLELGPVTLGLTRLSCFASRYAVKVQENHAQECFLRYVLINNH